MGVELDLTDDRAVEIGCQKAAAYQKFIRHVQKGELTAAVTYAAWSFCLDDVLRDAAPEEIQRRIAEENETQKP